MRQSKVSFVKKFEEVKSRRIYIPKRKKTLEWVRKAVKIILNHYSLNDFVGEEADRILLGEGIPQNPIMKLSQYGIIESTGYTKRQYGERGIVGVYRLKKEAVEKLVEKYIII
jgi:hypothetical protein